MVYGINMARIQLWGVSAILKELNKVKEMEKVGGHKAYEAIQIMISRAMMRWVSIKQEF